MNTGLTQAIDDMRSMRDVYDSLLETNEVFSPELQAGKQALATAIQSKGIQSSPSDTMLQMASQVQGISQQPITLEGSEMYETQLFGAPTDMETAYQQPDSPLWNLYKVMTDLLNDGRFITAGGIMLAEYFKGYETIELKGLGPGGRYLTCDGDLYDTNREGADAHVWHDNNNGKMNRWVAYIFAGENEGYTIPSTSLCPRSIHIGRRVGTITCSVAGRIREIVVVDGTEQSPNVLAGTNFTSTQPWQQEVTLRNVSHSQGYLFNANGSVVSIALDNCTITSPIIYNKCGSLTSIYLGPNVKLSGSYNINEKRVLTYCSSNALSNYCDLYYLYISDGLTWGSLGLICMGYYLMGSVGHGITIDGTKTLRSPIFSMEMNSQTLGYTEILVDAVEVFSSQIFSLNYGGNGILATYLKKISAKSCIRGLSFSNSRITMPILEDVVVGPMETNLNCSAWNPTSLLSNAEKVALINSNIREHIAANVADGNNTLTFTVSTNLYNNLEQATLDAFEAKHWLVAGA